MHKKNLLEQKLCQLQNMVTTLHAIGQTIALLGPKHHNPCLQPNGTLIFVLKHQFQSYKKEVPPPTCVEPLPVKLIELAVQACHASNTAKEPCIADMITIGFLFLCCLGEHTVAFDNTPFKLSNVQFYKDDKPVPIKPSKLLHTADFLPSPSTHKRTTQKASASVMDILPPQHSAPSWQ